MPPLQFRLTSATSSIVKGCSVRAKHGGISAIQTHGLQMEDNVVYTEAGHSFSLVATSAELRGNLALWAPSSAATQHAASYAVDIGSGFVSMVNNVAAGSLGYGISLQFSKGAESSTNGLVVIEILNSTIHSSACGIGIHEIASRYSFHPDSVVSAKGLRVYRNRLTGVSVSTDVSIRIDKSLFVANGGTNVHFSDIAGGSFVLNASTIIGWSDGLSTNISSLPIARTGVQFGPSAHVLLSGILFAEFNEVGAAAIRLGTTPIPNAANVGARVQRLQFRRVSARAVFSFEHQGAIMDSDGSLGDAPGWVLPNSSLLPPSQCRSHVHLGTGYGYPCAICDNAIFRFDWKSIDTPEIVGQVVMMKNIQGSTAIPATLGYNSQNRALQYGYSALLPLGNAHSLEWPDVEFAYLRAYSGLVHGMQNLENESVAFTHSGARLVNPQTLHARTFRLCRHHPEPMCHACAVDLGVDTVVPSVMLLNGAPAGISFNETTRQVTVSQAGLTQVYSAILVRVLF